MENKWLANTVVENVYQINHTFFPISRKRKLLFGLNGNWNLSSRLGGSHYSWGKWLEQRLLAFTTFQARLGFAEYIWGWNAPSRSKCPRAQPLTTIRSSARALEGAPPLLLLSGNWRAQTHLSQEPPRFIPGIWPLLPLEPCLSPCPQSLSLSSPVWSTTRALRFLHTIGIMPWTELLHSA